MTDWIDCILLSLSTEKKLVDTVFTSVVVLAWYYYLQKNIYEIINGDNVSELFFDESGAKSLIYRQWIVKNGKLKWSSEQKFDHLCAKSLECSSLNNFWVRWTTEFVRMLASEENYSFEYMQLKKSLKK